jgi:glycosyltransferase involved in cell wall biosynthesis
VLRTNVAILGDALRFRPTHVFVPDFAAALRCAPALWILRRYGVPVIMRLGNAPGHTRLDHVIWKTVLDRCVDLFVSNSDFIRRELAAHGVDPEKMRVIYNTAPARGAYAPAPRTRGRIIYVGQIIPPKGIAALLDAVAIVRGAGVAASLDVVGDIDGWEPPAYAGYRQALRDRAARPDLAGAVRFLGPREDVPELMAAAALHCLPSRPEQKEGFAVVTLEAKRAGLPSVVTPSGSLPEVVRHGVDGWVARDFSAEAIAEGLLHFLASADRLAQASEHARRADAYYSHERFAAAWAEVFGQSGTPIVEAQPA